MQFPGGVKVEVESFSSKLEPKSPKAVATVVLPETSICEVKHGNDLLQVSQPQEESRCLDVDSYNMYIYYYIQATEDVDMYIHSRNCGETISTHLI